MHLSQFFPKHSHFIPDSKSLDIFIFLQIQNFYFLGLLHLLQRDTIYFYSI